MDIFVNSEIAPLQSVIVGYPDNFLQVEPEIINETQRRFYFGPNSPTREAVTEQLYGFIRVLEQHGVTVYQPRPLPYLPDQMMTRDIGIVLGNTFIVTTMAAKSRRLEWRGIAWLFEQFPRDTETIFAPEDIVIEGGDVVVDKGKIFVGIGQRTTLAGAAWLMQNAPQFEIVPVNLKALNEGEDVLHLDCSFLPVGNHFALIYPDGLRDIPASLRESYELIEVTQEEQHSLATNVVSISPDVVISRPTSIRINKLLRERGLEVIEVHYPDPPKTGGSFRCCTLPLFRKETH
ncbi:MAG: arginine deiminase family protein [Chloroflexota bacterium]